ncbi:MAG: carboxylating nicotinate-nucleotide diphosphorylase [Coriobacteriia bacterium]|nr:carboxylating nicotinate-nucleotide diphosphorylase [Coriobacteriia bacterium]MBN2847250.1 carboxylating nicotinate-nucleotide diphosphorylase [Coriobacteriia bacterium]
MIFTLPTTDDLIAAALAEDLGVQPSRVLSAADTGAPLLDRDVTSSATVPGDAVFTGSITARDAGVACGLPAVARTFEMLAHAAGSLPVNCFPLVAEGADVASGTAVMEISGPARTVLAAERTALDIVMVLSGIATEARRWQRAAGDRMAVTDTRKTLPGLRALSKYAVAVGGAHNHRAGLFDMVLIKDNHIAHAGGIAAAVAAARAAHSDLLVECEADSIEQAVEAARAGADYVLLDNMDDATLTRAVEAVRETAAGRKCLTEASGRVMFDRLPALAATGVDRVSSSALTLARPMDFGLDAG